MNNIRRASIKTGLVVMGVTAAVVGFVTGGSVWAQPPTLPADPTGGAVEDAGATVQAWVLTYAVPTLLALTVLGIMVRLGRKWLRRAGGSV